MQFHHAVLLRTSFITLYKSLRTVSSVGHHASIIKSIKAHDIRRVIEFLLNYTAQYG